MRALTSGLLVLLACGGPEDDAQTPAPELAAYSIHEWGFIAHHYAAPADELLTSGTAPTPASGTSVGLGNIGHIGHGGKPVLYVHLEGDGDIARFVATLSTSGTFVEEWPHSETSTPTSLTWEVEARRGSCSAEGSYPAAGDGHCTGITDHYCEAAELAHYETDDSACLTVDGNQWNHLFYRAQTTGELPISVSKVDANFTVRGALAIPGRIMRIRRAAHVSGSRVVIFDAPAAGQNRVAPEPYADAVSGIRALETELGARGMSADEVQSFMTAWQAELFGETAEHPRVQMVGQPPFGLQPKRDALIYFLPAATLDAMVPLSFTPSPTEVHRAVLVRIDLGEAEPTYGGGTGYGRRHSPRPTVRMGELTVRGDVLVEVARRIGRRHLNEVRNCYTEHVPAAEARHTLELIVAASGTVESASVTGAAGPLQACVVASAQRWVFPPPDTETRISIPLSFARPQ